mmetsp:Transcript_55936/g.83356  ORF Transcript_55936/g.83356 Transcript_55936/m.83356 type:complete len:224 (-) Transcript_55936:404-1075(-)
MQDGQILYIRVNRTYLSTTTTTTTLDSNSFLSSELSISAVWGRSGRFIFSSPLSCIVCTVMTRCNSRRRLFHCHLTFSLYLIVFLNIIWFQLNSGGGSSQRHSTSGCVFLERRAFLTFTFEVEKRRGIHDRKLQAPAVQSFFYLVRMYDTRKVVKCLFADYTIRAFSPSSAGTCYFGNWEGVSAHVYDWSPRPFRVGNGVGRNGGKYEISIALQRRNQTALYL